MSDPTPLPGSVRSWRSRAAHVIAIAAIVITPSLYSFRFVSFSDAKLAGWALAVAALAAVAPNPPSMTIRLARRFWPVLIGLSLAATLLLVGFLLQGRVTLFRVPELAASSITELSLLLVAVFFVSEALNGLKKPVISIAIVVSGLPVAAMGLLQFAGYLEWMFPVFPEYDQRVYSVFGNQDLFGGYMAVCLSLALALGLSDAVPKVFHWAAPTLLLTALILSGSRSAWLAAVVGCAIAIAQFRPTRGRVLTGGAIGALIIVSASALAPESTYQRLASSFGPDDVGYRIRLWIWDGSTRMIADHWLAGVGPGQFQYFSPGYLGEALYARGPGVHVYNRLHTTHAHSDYLEVLSEGGIAGALLLVLFVAMLPREKSPSWSALGAGLTFSLVNTTLHSPPHVFAILACTAALPERSPTAGETAQGARWPCRMLAMAVCVASIPNVFVPSILITRAEATVARGDDAATESAYRAAARVPGARYEACKALAILSANDGRYARAAEQVDCALDGLDTGDVHYLAGYIAEMRGDFPRARTEYSGCVSRWPGHVRAWEGMLALAPDKDRDELLIESRRWVDSAAAERFTSLREQLRTGPVPRSVEGVP